MTKDVFLCHASEDKANVVRPLSQALIAANISCWLDEAEIHWGDSITEKVNQGLASSRYVIVVLSEAFLNKNWPKRELNAMLNIEASSGEVKLLPLLVGATDILNRLPLLNDKLYLNWQGNPDSIVQELNKLKNVPNITQTPSPNNPIAVSKIPLPKIRKQFTERDKDKFLKTSFQIIKDYFENALQELEKHYKGQNLETEFTEIHRFKFLNELYLNGKIVNKCKIWLGGLDQNSISYSEGRNIDINNDASSNAWVRTEEGESDLFLKPTFMSFVKQEKSLTPQQAAEYFWQQFIGSLR